MENMLDAWNMTVTQTGTGRKPLDSIESGRARSADNARTYQIVGAGHFLPGDLNLQRSGTPWSWACILRVHGTVELSVTIGDGQVIGHSKR